MNIMKAMEQFENEVIDCIHDAISFEGTLTFKEADKIADYLLDDVINWVGAEAYSEALIGFFATPSKELTKAIKDRDFQEVGVLLSEDIRKEIVNIILIIHDEIQERFNYGDY